MFASSADYDARVDELVASGAILDRATVYWDVRRSEHLPTVEVRVGDVPATVDGSVLLAVLVRALVMTALGRTHRCSPCPPRPSGRPTGALPGTASPASPSTPPPDDSCPPGRVLDLVCHVEPALRHTVEDCRPPPVAMTAADA